MHARMNDKRLGKLNPLQSRRDLFVIEGDADATLGVIAWGSIAGVALEAVAAARARGVKVKLLVPKLVYPVAEKIYQEFFASLDQCLVVEQSHQGQLFRIIRMWVNVPAGFQVMAKSGANPISPEEVTAKILQLAGAPAARPTLVPTA
jgi:2-oxoglutarate ferredoxin oxidoreductase subunit alpha